MELVISEPIREPGTNNWYCDVWDAESGKDVASTEFCDSPREARIAGNRIIREAEQRASVKY